MIGSIKLLVATLGISQFSGVVEARGHTREDREELRRNLRKGGTNTVAQNERKTQFVFDDVVVNDDAPNGVGFQAPDANEFVSGVGFDENQDDLFAVNEGIVDANVPGPTDDFFKYTEDGMVFDWDSAGHTHEEDEDHDHDHDEDHDHDHEVRMDYYGGKTGKFSKQLSPQPHSPKAGKIGKVMWEETPVMVKSGKGYKSSKNAKKGGKSAKGYYRYESEDGSDHHDEHHVYEEPHDHDEPHDPFDHDHDHSEDWLSGFESSSSLGYNDLFNHDSHVTTTTDDFFDNTARMDVEPATRMSAGDVMARSHMNTFDDDFFTTPDTRLVFLPRPTVTVAGSIFSQNSQNVLAPIVPNGSGDTLSLGTEYLFNDLTFDAQNILSQYIPLQVDSTLVEFSVALDGICSRIGPADQNSVQGYCFFTYTFLDPFTQLVAGAFTAQGIIVNSSVPGQLTVSGGTGIMTGATGVVEILPAAVDNSINPPMLVQPLEGSDPFNGVAGWAHFFEFDVDVLFFLPELYAR